MDPDTCAVIRCKLDPYDDGTCCPAEEEEPEEEPEEEETPVRGWPSKGACCPGLQQCCCGKCRSPRDCAVIDCFVLEGTDTCCKGDDKPKLKFH
eukprot:jgi/Ulvmu1/6375/UM003_0003.1